MYMYKTKQLTTCTYFASCSLVILVLSYFDTVETRLVWIPRLENLEDTITNHKDTMQNDEPPKNENTVRILYLPCTFQNIPEINSNNDMYKVIIYYAYCSR